MCSIIKGENPSIPRLPCRLYDSKILAVFGDMDTVIVAKDVAEDLESMFGGGPDHLEIKMVPGTHGFPIPTCDEVVKHIVAF